MKGRKEASLKNSMSLICYPGFMSDKAGKWKIDLRGVRQWWEKSEIRTESWWERRVMVSWVILAQRSGCKMYIEEKNEIRSRNQATIKRRYWKKKRKGALMNRNVYYYFIPSSHTVGIYSRFVSLGLLFKKEFALKPLSCSSEDFALLLQS